MNNLEIVLNKIHKELPYILEENRGIVLSDVVQVFFDEDISDYSSDLENSLMYGRIFKVISAYGVIYSIQTINGNPIPEVIQLAYWDLEECFLAFQNDELIDWLASLC